MVNFLLLSIGLSENSPWHKLGRRQGRSQQTVWTVWNVVTKIKILALAGNWTRVFHLAAILAHFRGKNEMRIFWTGKFPSIYYSLKAWVLRPLALLGLLVRIPQESWMSTYCECCALSGRGIGVRLITCPGKSYQVWCVWVWWRSLDDQEAPAH